jgi:hypothetical protein
MTKIYRKETFHLLHQPTIRLNLVFNIPYNGNPKNQSLKYSLVTA